MAIVVAPATLFKPGTLVTQDVFGDSADTIHGSARNQTFVYTAAADTSIYGDAHDLAGTATGGRDSFTAKGLGALYGDADSIVDSARGGNDTIKATGPKLDSGADQLEIAGDANTMSGHALGGNDTIHAFRFTETVATPSSCPSTPAAATTCCRSTGGG